MLDKLATRVATLLGHDSPIVRRLRPAYETLLSWSNRGCGVPCTINGVALRRDPRCRQYYPYNFDYEPAVAAQLRAMVRPEQICFDVGANVGYYALQFAHWCRPSGRVLAFEPNPGPRLVLERQIAVNRLAHRVEVVPFAVAETSGETTLYVPGANHQGLHGISRLGAADPHLSNDFLGITVPVTSLDDFCAARELEPDWVLIDIEGFEIAALKGARRLIAKRRAHLGLIVEMHPDLWDSVGTPRQAAEALFAEFKVRTVPLTGQRDPLAERGVVHLVCE
jgi:FkbM family methyltransferase